MFGKSGSECVEQTERRVERKGHSWEADVLVCVGDVSGLRLRQCQWETK